jgi:hypothetical protein
MYGRLNAQGCSQSWDALRASHGNAKPAKFDGSVTKKKKPMFVAAPPGRYASARDLKPRLEITIGRIRKHLFPASLTHPDGKTVTRPLEYNP